MVPVVVGPMVSLSALLSVISVVPVVVWPVVVVVAVSCHVAKLSADEACYVVLMSWPSSLDASWSRVCVLCHLLLSHL